MNFRQVHLDFHTSGAIDGIGAKFDKKQFQEALKAGHVNSITVFSKCHHGWAYHPSKANETHPGLKFDLLKAQIEAAHEIGVKTPVYLSAGIDEKYARKYPMHLHFDDRSISYNHFNGPGFHRLCLNTPYLDVLLDQITEVVTNYDADGIFLDIVGACLCYCPTCLAMMLERGLDPAKQEDALKLGEEVYANYLKRVRETIDAVKPGLPVFHNGGHIRQGRRDHAYANSHLELESLPTGGWGYDHFPFSARYAQNLGMEFLGMTGKFHTMWGEFGGYKHPNAIKYEVALSAAHGAKCSIGDQMPPDGHMDMRTYELIGAGYSELEEKEEWLDNVTPVCDVALLSLEACYNDLGSSYAGRTLTKSDVGAGRILLEGKYAFSVIDKYVDFDKFKVIILPDKVELTEEIANKLKTFVKGGGKILATGSSAICNGEFMFDFGAKCEGDCKFVPSYVRPLWDNDYESDFVMYSPCKKISLNGGTELAKLIEPYFNRTKEHFCSHQHAPSSGKYGGAGMVCGKDGIYIAWEIFEDYATKGELIAKQVVCKALDVLLVGEKSLVTNLGSIGVTTLMEQKDKNRVIAHLLYATPIKRGEKIEVIEDLLPVCDTELAVKLDKPVKRVYLAPQGIELPFETDGDYTRVSVDKFVCHQMVVFDI